MTRRYLQAVAVLALLVPGLAAQNSPAPRQALIDGTEPGWRALQAQDFAAVNGGLDTWTWIDDGLLRTSGKPIGVLRTKELFTNVELMVEWRHLEAGGNSGVFVWVPEQALRGLAPGVLPDYGIEVQMLDHGFAEKYAAQSGRKGD